MRARHFLNELGKEVKGRREARGLTQEKLAEASAISVGALRKLEGAKGEIQLGTLCEVARGLCMPLSELVLRTERRRA